MKEVERELGLTDTVKMPSNENPLGPSPKAVRAVKAILPDLNIYPEGSGFYLCEVRSKFFGVPASHIILGNGSVEVVEIAAKSLLRNSRTRRFGIPGEGPGAPDVRFHQPPARGVVVRPEAVAFLYGILPGPGGEAKKRPSGLPLQGRGPGGVLRSGQDGGQTHPNPLSLLPSGSHGAAGLWLGVLYGRETGGMT